MPATLNVKLNAQPIRQPTFSMWTGCLTAVRERAGERKFIYVELCAAWQGGLSAHRGGWRMDDAGLQCRRVRVFVDCSQLKCRQWGNIDGREVALARRRERERSHTYSLTVPAYAIINMKIAMQSC